MANDIVQRVAPVGIQSPCILVCVLDTRTGWCLGCGRTGEEIGAWTSITSDARQAIMDGLPDRLAQLKR